MCEVNDGTPAGIVIKADVVSSALYGLLSSEFDTCSLFLSEISCNAAIADIEAESGLDCECTSSDIAGSTNMECSTVCGYTCNMDESICFTEERLLDFSGPGTLDSAEITYEYKIGNEDIVDNGEPPFFTVRSASDFCSVSTAFPFWLCDCNLIDCGDGTSLPELFCENFQTNEIFDYDYCNPSTVDVASFVALSEGDFNECVDKSQPNDSCAAAIPVTIDAAVTTSTQHILQTQADSCLGEAVEGVWYTFIGTGDFLQVSPCNSEFNAATRITIQKGSCDALECAVDTQVGCQKSVWLAEAGVIYAIHISTDQSDVISSDMTMHGFRVESILPSIEGCLQDVECECLYVDSSSLATIQSCASICEEYCNREVSACGQISVEESLYDETGVDTSSTFQVEYVFPWTESIFLTILRETNTCEGGISGDVFTPCTSCQLVECPDSNLLAPLLNCSNFDDGGVYHLCGEMNVDNNSRFQALDDGQLKCILNGTVAPTSAPSEGSTAIPLTDMPSVTPSTVPSRSPTVAPSRVPSSAAPVADDTTSVPSSSSTKSQSQSPSQSPVVAPTADVNTASAVPSSGELVTDAPVGTTNPVTTSAPTASSSWTMQLSGACTFIIEACTVMLSTMN